MAVIARPTYSTRAAAIEAEILTPLREDDPEGRHDLPGRFDIEGLADALLSRVAVYDDAAEEIPELAYFERRGGLTIAEQAEIFSRHYRG